MNAAIALTSGMRHNLFEIQRSSRLQSINALRLSTGKKINSALDNPVNFFTAVEHTNRARDLMMRKDEMGEGVQTIRAASTGIDTMLELIDSAEALTKSAQSSGSSEEIDALANQYNETLNQMNGIANDASYKGVGLLRCPPESMTICFDEAGDSSLTVEGECSSAAGLGLSRSDNIEQSDGEFVITWLSGNSEIYGQKYDNSGNKWGVEFQINTNTADSESYPFITALSDGGFVAVWDSDYSGSDEIYGQRFDSSGNQVGGEFQINTSTADSQSNPAVTSLSDDGFVVVWEDAGTSEVLGQRFDSSGNKMAGEFTVATVGGGRPKITELSDGGFVAVWCYSITNSQDVYGQRFDSSGTQVGGRFRINTNASHDQKDAQIAALSDGGFVVAWESPHTGSWEIYAQKYDSSGNQVGGEFQVNTYTGANQLGPTISELTNGGFVVAWNSYHDGAWGVYGQMYDSSGNEVDGEFGISPNNGVEGGSQIRSLSDGGFLVAYHSRRSGSSEVFGKRYDSSGNQVGEAFQVNTSTAGDQIQADLIALGSLGTWQGNSANIQTSLDELQAAKERLRTLQSKFSNNLSIITTRSSFTDSMVNVLETGAGNLTNADLNEEGAHALMLQTQQSLGMSSLSIASQEGQSVLRLFS